MFSNPSPSENTWNAKVLMESEIMTTLLARCLLLTVSALFSVLPPNMFTDHVDISQAFVQGKLLPGDSHNGNVYISSPLVYEEDFRYIYGLLKPLYGMPSAAFAWHTTMSAFLEEKAAKPWVSKKV